MPSADFLGNSEPIFESTFLIYFTKLPAITPLYVASGALPSMQWEEQTSSYFITQRKFASRFKLDDTDLKIKDFVDVNSAAACYAWFLSVGDWIKGQLNPPKQYKSDAIYMLTNGQEIPINTWHLQGCWPTACKFGNLDTTSNNIVSIDMTISIDSIDLA
jgi:hypothetical protein